jgi:hypothetical protein
MTDVTSHAPRRRPGSARRTPEFMLYFALIFLLELPTACVAWVRDIIRHRTLNLLGPLARAWAEADRITPLIFSV